MTYASHWSLRNDWRTYLAPATLSWQSKVTRLLCNILQWGKKDSTTMKPLRSLTIVYMIIFGFTLTSPVLNATAGVPAQDATVLPTPTWQAYLQDCGLKAIDANEARSTQVFEANYKGKTIHWSGKLDTIKPGWWGKYTILVLMDPTESVMHELDANNGSDLSLTVPATFKKLALSLNKGDMIIFDGTIDTQGGHFSHHTITVTNLLPQIPSQPPKHQNPQKSPSKSQLKPERPWHPKIH